LSQEAIDAEQLVRTNIGWMIGVAQRLLKERALAEDAVQEAFIAAFAKLDGLQQQSSLKGWLHRITVNAALMKLRKMKRLAEEPIDDLLPEFDRNDCRLEAPWGALPSVEEVLETAECRERVHTAIDGLPDGYRTLLLLRDIEGYSTLEVAELLELSQGAVKVRLHRARAALKKRLEPLFREELGR